MIVERDIIEPVRLRLQDLLRVPVKSRAGPVRQQGPDATFEAGRFRFVVEAKASSRLASVHLACEQARQFAREARPVAIPLVAVPIMGPSGRRLCEQAKVSFIDVAGNAHLEAPGLLIHVEGRRDRKAASGRPASVFAPRSSRVARLLLLDPKRWWRQSEMAERSRLGRGYISRIVARLVGDGLLEKRDDGSVSPRDPDLLLDAWQDEYAFRRHRILAGHVAARTGEELAGRLAAALKQRGTEYAFTGLPAAARLASFASFRLVAAYLRQVPAEDLLHALGFHASEFGANTWLVLPNDDGVFDGSTMVGEQVCVSAVQAYLDLLAMPERAKEAAAHLRRECLGWR